LSNILPAWQSINSLIDSASAINLVDNVATALNLALAMPASEALSTVTGFLADLTALMNGSFITTSTAISSLLGTCQSMAADFSLIVNGLESNGPFTPDVDTGQVDWSADVEDATLDDFDNAVSATTIADALRFQDVAGKFYGMSRLEYRRFLEAGGELGGTAPIIKGSVIHTVNVNDTPRTIAARYSVDWQSIVRLNQRTTSELLIVGNQISVPVERTWGAPGLDGLPVYGSHVGLAALGTDLQWPPVADTDGSLVMVAESDCLLQGIHMLSYGELPGALADLQGMPVDMINAMAQQKTVLVYQSDPRVQSVSVDKPVIDNVTATLKLSGVTIEAINGIVLGA
jgi:hypothetical protein